MNTELKKIAVVAPYFPPHTGGLERYAAEIASRLQRDHRWRVVVITTAEKGAEDTTEERAGMAIYRLKYRFRFSNTPFSFSWFFKVPQILQREKPDIVNVHTPVPGIGDIAAFFTTGKRLVVTYHTGSMRKNRFVPDIFIWLYEHGPMRYMLKRAKHIICSSDFVRNEFLSKYADKSVTVTPAVDSLRFRPSSKTKDFPPTVLFVVANLGKSGMHKGLTTLIEAISAVRKVISDACISVVGDGDMRAVYERYLRELGLADAVTFKGKLAGDALAGAYRDAHVFALPTVNDSSPMVILEAMASGLPTVTTRIGGIPSIVDDQKTGFLIDPHDVNALSEKIIELLKNPAYAVSFGAEARAKILKGYRWDTRAKEYDSLFRRSIASLSPIAHIIASYPPQIGGMERIAASAAKLLAGRGHTVSVITSSGNITRGSVERSGNVVVKKIPSIEFLRVPFAPTLLLELLRLPRNTLIHLHLAQAYWPEVTLLAATLKRMHYIVHFHLDVGPSGALGSLFLLYKKLVWRPVLRGADRVIVCSSGQVNIVANTYGVAPSKITLIPNAVNEDFFTDRSYAPSRDSVHLLYVGRLAAQKRVERLIEAMRFVSSPAELTIVGDGEDRKKLEALAEKHHLGNIVFAGVKNDREIREYHEASDAFVISSEQEGLPLSVLEAMAGGLPVIASNVTGMRELVQGVGIL
ncbi:MAG: glycosyltransferase family 4 protein, partial [bacterium]|nr:glycosyltransferase family 4 protein [bacterium]